MVLDCWPKPWHPTVVIPDWADRAMGFVAYWMHNASVQAAGKIVQDSRSDQRAEN